MLVELHCTILSLSFFKSSLIATLSSPPTFETLPLTSHLLFLTPPLDPRSMGRAPSQGRIRVVCRGKCKFAGGCDAR